MICFSFVAMYFMAAVVGMMLVQVACSSGLYMHHTLSRREWIVSILCGVLWPLIPISVLSIFGFFLLKRWRERSLA